MYKFLYRNSSYLRLFSTIFLSLSIFVVATTDVHSATQNFGDSSFARLWQRTDKQVLEGKISRSFLWGPAPSSHSILEDYADASGGRRLVQYFDKSRMELTDPNGDQSNVYYVTNGLLAKELMTGRLQLGDTKFEQHSAAEIGVAGDEDDTSSPTYKALEKADQPANNVTGLLVAGFMDRDGNISFDKGDYGKKRQVKYTYFEPSTQHNIAGPFWSYLNQTGLILNPNGQQGIGRLFDPVFFATGLPITEAYWAQVKVGGQIKDVLIQAFERRVLTFTPSNDIAYQVEMGNVGQHYYRWRYTTLPPLHAKGCLPDVSTVGDLIHACVDNPNPPKNSDVTVYAQLIIGGQYTFGSHMSAIWDFGTRKVPCSYYVTGLAQEVWNCALNIGEATSGVKINIEVQLTYNGKTYTTQTSFVPQ